MSCQIPSHDSQKIKYICLDKSCSSSKKTGCADCFLESHATHKRMMLEEFQNWGKAKTSLLEKMKFEVIKEEVRNQHTSYQEFRVTSFELDAVVGKLLADRMSSAGQENWKHDFNEQLYERNREQIRTSIAKMYLNPVLRTNMDRTSVQQIP